MSADVSARSVSRADGVDRVRALQRVLYRCAKQDEDRRFHALYDKVARSDVLGRVFEADFLPTSHGFRPGRSAQHALEAVRQAVTWRGKVWVLDADIRSCFDEIDHDALLWQIERRVCDRRVLKLLRGWLRAGVFEGGIVSAIEAGTPQGSPISPLLANIAL